VWDIALADAWVDPVGRIAAQDEAVYSHTALRMAREGDWLTPRFLERYVLYKPPLAYWLQAASVQLFGVSPFALRLPSLLAAAAAAGLVFRWVLLANGLWPAVAAVLLLTGSRLYFGLARLALMDALLTLCFVVALDALGRDPDLATRRARWVFGLATGCAILTKWLAGLLPVVLLVVFWSMTRRFRWRAARETGLAVLLVAAPWFLYQFAVHREWLLAEMFGVEFLGYAIGSPPQTSPENVLWFYGRRLLLMDPILCGLGLFALARRRPVLLTSAAAALAFALLAYQYRNIAYAMPLAAVFALAAAALPWRAWSCSLLVALVAAKATWSGAPWSLPFQSENVLAQRDTLDAYCRLARPNELILVEPRDDFAATVRPLAGVRYLWIGLPAGGGLDFRALGITVTVEDFLAGRVVRGRGIDPRAVATALDARSVEEVRRLILARPESDYLAPDAVVAPILSQIQATHEVRSAPPGYRLLLARRRGAATLPESRWPCAM
jgi:hypothetical protein